MSLAACQGRAEGAPCEARPSTRTGCLALRHQPSALCALLKNWVAGLVFRGRRGGEK